MASILTFFLACNLASILTFFLASILASFQAFYLASILTYILTFCLALYLAFSLACVRVQAWPTVSGAVDFFFSGPGTKKVPREESDPRSNLETLTWQVGIPLSLTLGT